VSGAQFIVLLTIRNSGFLPMLKVFLGRQQQQQPYEQFWNYLDDLISLSLSLTLALSNFFISILTSF
jgi:hypothetical protein